MASSLSRPLLALIVGQIALHSAMAGLRLAAPLKALAEGRSAGLVGVLLALFALTAVALALPAGRLVDRFGYHRPLYWSVALSTSGCLLAFLWPHFLVLCAGAVLTGAGANLGLIAIQRSAGRMATDATQRLQVFSWLGLAPALANLVGPVLAGAVIDHGGFRAAFAALAMLPIVALTVARAVPPERRSAPRATPTGPRRRAWDLLQLPGVRRVLWINWLLSASWDVHSFAVPILGHQRGLDATAIGLVLGTFAGAVALVRMAIPLVAHRLTERQVLTGATLATGAILVVYPLAEPAWAMAVCAGLLGLALGTVQPMVMSLLHELTPADRHGEAIALRSMSLNFSSSLMPLVFGALGAVTGAGVLFWIMGALVASGSVQARQVPER